MKHFMNLPLCLLASFALASTGCSDDDGGRGMVSSKMKLTLDNYYNSNGGVNSPVWQAGDEASVLVAQEGKSPVYTATPILYGSATDPFLFTVETLRKEPSTLVSYYPSTAEVSLTDGVLNAAIPAVQDGTVSPCLVGWQTCLINAYEGCNITLRQLPATFYVHIAKGNYEIAKVEVTGNQGEGLAGNVGIDLTTGEVSASQTSVSVSPATPVSCSLEPKLIPVLLAPVTLASGYTVRATTTDGEVIEISSDESVALASGERFDTSDLASQNSTKLFLCGSEMVYLIDPDLCTSTYKEGVLWSWNATSAADLMGLAASRCTHLDDCKPVDNGTKLLVTSSYSFALLLDYPSGNPIFYTTQCTGAHSAEMLPNNRLVVANSSTGDCLQVYDISSSNRVLFTTALTSAHGVVWLEETQRLYAVGGQVLNIYKLEDWDTSSPKLVLESSVKTPKSGTHDLTAVSSTTLCVSGNGSYLYNVVDNSFTELTLFSSSTALKSVNYNVEDKSVWYTDATNPEGTQTWSTQTLHFATNPMGSTDAKTIKVPDLDVYKVRVLNW